jgi:homoserine kinase
MPFSVTGRPGMRYRLRVPASSANLGPGFDALGLALGLHLDCFFEQAAELEIRAEGRDSELISTGPDNLVWQTALDVARAEGMVLPAAKITMFNEIPLGKGLGSSAAALVAGVVMAGVLLRKPWDREKILEIAAQIEGHPDNVAACVFGSIVASALDDSGVARAVRLDLPRDFGLCVVVPDFPLPTVEARRVLPQSYSRHDAIFNVQRAALLMAALATGAKWAFPLALQDKMHQPYRESLIPGLKEMLALRKPGLLGCALSGAGPSVLVFYESGHEYVYHDVVKLFLEHGHRAEAQRVPIANGYHLSEAPLET